jgi:hypothetical protein
MLSSPRKKLRNPYREGTSSLDIVGQVIAFVAVVIIIAVIYAEAEGASTMMMVSGKHHKTLGETVYRTSN